MSNLIRWNPARELANLRDTMNRILEEGFASVSRTPALALDMYETKEAIVVQTSSLIGIDAEDIDVSITGDVLTIRGETKTEEEVEGVSYLRRERRFGSFVRSVNIPRPVKAEETTAKFENGVLIITLPKAAETHPKVIEVKPTED